MNKAVKVLGIEALAFALLLAILHTLSPEVTVALAANELHVCKSGGDFTTIQAAVDAAAPNDVIKVATGVYTEGRNGYNLLVTKTVHLLGGYVCGTWGTQNAPANVVTIRPTTTNISVVSLEGPFTPTLDGFTITGGGGGNHGGGIRATDSNALIRNNVITGNVGYLLGGGIWVQRGVPRIENNRIENNQVTGGLSIGGGVELEGTQATLIGNLVAHNVVSDTNGSGGGIAVVGDGPVTLVGNTVMSNTAASGSNIRKGRGGGVYAENVTVTLSSNVILDNAANASVGGFGGGGVYVVGSGRFTLTGNTVLNNSAGNLNATGPFLYGGGIFVETSRGVLAGNIISANVATLSGNLGKGGGIAILTSTVSVQGGLIFNNQTGLAWAGSGGGLYASNSAVAIDAARVEENYGGYSTSYGHGGGLAFENSPYTVTNAIILNNHAFTNDSAVGGLFAGANSPGLVVNNTFVNTNSSFRSQGVRVGSPLTLTNNIIMGFSTGVSVTAGAPVNVTFNDFYNDDTVQRGFSLDVSNLVINPMLNGNWRLSASSPLIDAGTHANAPDHDIDGEPRAMLGASGLYRIDIGADEFTGKPQRQVNLDTAPADLTVVGPGGIQGHPDPNANNWIGFSVMGKDVNGDGRDDLMIAAQDWAEDFDTLNATGRLFGLFNFGARVTGTIDLYTTTPNLNVVSKYPYQHVGQAFASGDLNGDGKRDLIMSANNDDNTKISWPAVFVLYGGAGLNGTRTLSDVTPADFRLRAPGPDYGEFANKNMLAAGDLSGDGKDDLVVGDPLANDGVLTRTGAVFVTFGSSTLGGTHNLSTTLTDFMLYGPLSQAHLAKVALGQLSADAQRDMVARTDTTAYGILGPIAGGSRHLSTAPADLTITGLQAGGVHMLDFNGDGKDDLLLGSIENSVGKLYVLYGPFSGGQSFNVRSRAALTITNIAASVFATGDVVGDPKPDLIIGQPDSPLGAVVVPGGMNLFGTYAVEDLMALSVKGGSVRFVGQDVAAGDLDRDGKEDLIVGSLFNNVDNHPTAFDKASKVFVFYGTRTGSNLYLPLIAR